jgi:hypothetical protein
MEAPMPDTHVEDLGNGILVSKPGPAPAPEPVTDPGFLNLYKWHKAELDELKGINSKLGWFVFLSIMAVLFSILGIFLR